MSEPAFRLVFVCMGNICRSPTAHAVMRHKLHGAGLAHRVHVDSAGTHDYHSGEPPDLRSQQHARKRGYELSDLRARPLVLQDFETADLLLTMDPQNLATALRQCPADMKHKLRSLTDFCRLHRADSVPDPYSGGARGFEQVLDLIEDACEGLLEQLRGQLLR